MPEKPATAIATLQQGASYTFPDGTKFLNGVPKVVSKRSRINEIRGNPRFSIREVMVNEDLDSAMASTHHELGQVEKAETSKAKAAKKETLKVAMKKKLKVKKGTK